ncbi:endo-1,3(4)-beta-glucanase [Blastomyces dermatitidis ATCC 18188]|uniref:Endo-1,3(4)-beta-glucanase n=1 Tax=Ajellomyces dermatitidis (strain ATCC 18188 / CBS 674.68) TaxID=653446 RepID=F2TG48_AJEDA|nr:endo-1,3(4)-beta-glucanase [Blastomyces dermatitidis ATCC 18188]
MKYFPCFAFFTVLWFKASAKKVVPRESTDDGSDSPNNPADRCECYVVSGAEPGYFQNYKFYDFRSVVPEKTWQPNSTTAKPARNRTSNSRKESHMTLEETGFLDDWVIQDWSRAGSFLFPIPIRNSYENVFVLEDTTNDASDTTYIALRTQRLHDHSSTAEIETYSHDYFHCSFRVRLRLHAGQDGHLEDVDEHEDGDSYWGGQDHESVLDEDGILRQGRNRSELNPANFRLRLPPTGAVAGIFTYHSASVESDIEILTADPHTLIHYANQPDWDPLTDLEIPGAATIVELPVPWTSWATHRLDWFPNMSRWYLNNKLQAENDYHVPDKPSMLVLNLWSDGGEWSGNMTMGSTALMGIEWIEVAYNISDMDVEIYDSFNRTRPTVHSGISGNSHPKRTLEDMAGDGLKPRRGKLEYEYDGFDGDDGTTENGQQCLVGCRIDDVETVGVPEILWDYYY